MVSVVVPAFNEEEAISGTLEAIHRALDGAGESSYEVVVVDDGSTDGTAMLAEAAGARVIRNSQNIGYGYSVKKGIVAAKFDTIVITDADGTYPIELIPELLKPYREGFDMVVGARTGKYYRGSNTKTPLRFIFKLLVEFTTGRKIPDINSGLRVFSKEMAMPFFDFTSDSFSFTASITLAYMMKQKSVLYQEIPYRKRIGKTKVRLFRDALRSIQFIIKSVLIFNPIKLFLVISFFVFLMSSAFIASGFWWSAKPLIWIGAVGFFMVPLVFSIGMVAELLSQILDRTKR